MLNVSRRLPNGEIDNDEVLNKGQIYCTSAGYKNTFSYDKLIQLLIWQIIKPGSAFVMGGNWRLPVKMGLLDKNFVQELKNDGGVYLSAVSKTFLKTMRVFFRRLTGKPKFILNTVIPWENF